jgi:asparagine synthase (glutamine-hydrolysing)
MCSIAGLYVEGTARVSDLEVTVASMTAALIHRGPDDGGQWTDVGAGISLGDRPIQEVGDQLLRRM